MNQTLYKLIRLLFAICSVWRNSSVRWCCSCSFKFEMISRISKRWCLIIMTHRMMFYDIRFLWQMIFNPEIIAMILVQFALLTFINIAQDFRDGTVALRTWFRRTTQLKNLKLFISIWKNFPKVRSGKRVRFISWIYFPEKWPGIVFKKSNILEDRVSAGLKQK